jgi:DNA helicase-2/ATP-dependent DNA helicase PcrA
MSDFAGSEFLSLVYPSKIFNVQKHSELLDIRHNSSISALTEPDYFRYDQITQRILQVIKDPEIAHYQDTLLKKAIRDISANRVDIDYLEIGLQLTLTDIYKLIGSPEQDVLHSPITSVKITKRQARLQVNKDILGNKNRRFKKTDKRPFFTHKYRMVVDNDSYRYMDIYIADPAHERNKRDLPYNCSIEFIPTRLTLDQISFMLYQLQSVLGSRRYVQLLGKAKLLRIDTGYVMHGLSQLFCFPLRTNSTVKVSACIPDNKSAVETTYLGNHKDKRNHDIIYDKVLKEIKFFIKSVMRPLHCEFSQIAHNISNLDQLFSTNAASARIETRQYFPSGELSLSEIDQIDPSIHRIMFIRPKAIAALEDSQVLELICDKRLSTVRSVRSLFAKRYKYKAKKYLHKFDTEQVISEFLSKLEKMKAALYTPIKILEHKPLGNYQEHVVAAKNYLAPFVIEQRSKQDSVDDIVRSGSKCLYVEGSPGSGKTKVMVNRVKHLLETSTKPKIVVLAFTNDAADEFRRRLVDEGLMRSGMFVGTFSAWCNQYLQQVKSFKIINQDRSYEAIESSKPEKSSLLKHFESRDIARYVSAVLSYSVNYDQKDIDKCVKKVNAFLEPFTPEIKLIIKRYQKWKEQESKLDFNDLIEKMLKLVKSIKANESVPDILIPDHILLDEAQDTNHAQFDILKKFHSVGSSLFFVGDPAQSMYGFRGAVSFSYKMIKRYFGHADRFQLVENHRSLSPIVELANHIRYEINRNFSISVPLIPGSELPRYKQFDSIKSATSFLIKDLKKLKLDNVESVLILCRYKVHVKTVQKALKKLEMEAPEFKKIHEFCMTYHKSKGREAKYCYVFDPTFSSYSLGTVKEELCNTYVAFTRAKSNLTILASQIGAAAYGTTDKKTTKTSIFADIPVELVQPI